VRGWFARILLVTVLVQTAVFAIRPMVSYKAIAVGAGSFDLGVIAAAFAVIPLLVAVQIGRWVDRWAEPRFIVVGAAVIAASCLSLLWIDSIWALAASQAALGLGHIMTVVGTQTLVGNRGDPTRREARFGVFTVVVSLGQLAGPTGAGLLAGRASGPAVPDGTVVFGTGPVFLGAAAISLLATLAAIGLREARSVIVDPVPVPGNAARESTGQALWRVLRIPSMPHAMVASLTVLTTIDLLAVYLPAYGEANGLSVQTVGLLLGARAAASMASRILMLPLIKLLGRRLLLALSIAVPAVSLAVFPLLDAPFLLYTAMVLAGFGLGLGQPITIAWVVDRAPADVRGTAIGVRLSGNRLGQTVLPVGVGAIAGGAGVAAVFISLAVLLGLSAATVLVASFGAPDDPEPS
jgi:MFS family permease